MHDYNYVLTEPCPQKIDEESIETGKGFRKSDHANAMALAYMKISMTPETRVQYSHTIIASELLQVLDTVYEKQNLIEGNEVCSLFLSCRMKHGENPSNFLFTMLRYINAVEIHGVVMD